MPRLMHVIASPSGDRSRSTEVALELIEEFQLRHSDADVRTVNVWDIDLPHFDAIMIAAKFAVLRRQNATDEQKRRWSAAVAIAEEFNTADRYVFSLPMWNFGVPYRLKHYIDLVTLPGQNWSWSPDRGYQPLLRGRRAALIYSSAGDYPVGVLEPGNDDFQKPLMRRWLRFIGVEVAEEISVGPTLGAQDDLRDTLVHAKRAARAAAAAL